MMKRIHLSIILVLQLCFLSSSALADRDLRKGLPGIRISNQIEVEGSRFFTNQELLSQIRLRPGLHYSDHLLERSIDEILELYDESGFPYCQVSPAEFDIDEDGELSFLLRVQEGPRVTVGRIEFEGLENTKEKVIRRELGKDPFGYFSQSKVDRIVDRLGRLSYIQEVHQVSLFAESDPVGGLSPETAALRVTLTEAKNNSFSGILGYVPSPRTLRTTRSPSSQKGHLTGKIDLTFDNIFGTGRRVDLNWYKKDPYSSDLSFFYREPWILGLPPTLELRMNQTDYDSTYLKVSLALGLLFNPLEKISWEAEMGWEKVVPGSAGGEYIPHSRKHKAGVKLSINLLDPRDNPRRGFFHRAQVTCGRKRNYRTSDFAPKKEIVHDAKLFLDLQQFFPTFHKQTLMTGMHVRGMTTDDDSDDPSGVVPFPEQFKLGGIGSLRGYREEEFSGTKVAWTNLEYRFLRGRGSRFFVFADYGYFFRKARLSEGGSLREISGTKLGYGFGMRIDSKAGLFGIDYGIGENDRLSEGKIHFGVVNRF